MSFDDVLDELPNGLKDARLERVDVDIDRSKLTLTLQIWMGDDKSADGIAHEIFKRAQIVLDGIHYVIMPPGAIGGLTKGYLEIDGETEPSEDHETELPDDIPPVTLSLYLTQRGRFLHFGSARGELRWIDDPSR